MAYYKCGSIHPTQNSNVVVDTASGAIANFQTPLAMPLLKAQFDFKATQDLNGQSGPYPAGGGVNKFDKDTMLIDDAYINDTDGTQRSNVGDKCTDYIEILPNTAYYIVSEQTFGRWGAWYDENKAYISGINNYGSKTSPANAKYIRLTVVRQGSGNPDTFSVNYPATDMSYHPYSNICPIDGVSEVNVAHCRKNLFDIINIVYGYPLHYVIEYGGENMRTVFSKCKPNTTYTISKIKSERFIVFWCEDLPDIGVSTYGATTDNGATSITITTGSTAKYICAFVYNANVDTLTPSEVLYSIQIEESASATTYETYNGSTTLINLGGTYYGGYVSQDKYGKRELVVTHELRHLKDLNVRYSNNSGAWASWLFFVGVDDKKQGQPIKCTHYETVTINNIGNLDNLKITAPTWSIYIYWRDDTYTSADDFKQNAPDITIMVELAEPFTIALPGGQPIKSLPGINNIFADTGDTEVNYTKLNS